MSDAPETIFAVEDKDVHGGREGTGWWRNIEPTLDADDRHRYHSPIAYIRADLHAAVVAENERLLSVNQELQALANKAQSIAADQIDKTNRARAERDELLATLQYIALSEFEEIAPSSGWMPDGAADYVQEMEMFCAWAPSIARAALDKVKL